VLDELGAWKNVDETYNMLQFGLRLGKKPRQVITTTPKPFKLLRELLKSGRDDVAVTRGRTIDNKDNLPEAFLKQMEARYANTRLGRQELDAELLDDVQGALWKRDQIEATRLPPNYPVAFTRIVVAIDPAVTVSEDSDETGILVCGVDGRNHAYVLQDLSGKYSPTEWANIAVEAYKYHAADRIIIESNQGGDLCENTLRVVDHNVAIRRVTAKRGKLIRAEPVSACYEQGRVHHVGMFSALEDQLCTFAPGSTDSPDRLDALVYALTDLMVVGQRPQLVFGGIEPRSDLEVARHYLNTDRYH
jgi:phage terminase large subunit-like protein